METYVIKKAKITALSCMELEYIKSVENADDLIKSEITDKPRWELHPDLRASYNLLIPHLALLCELKPDGVLEEDHTHHDLQKLKVTGYSIGGEDEHEGVTLIGRKILANNKVLNLVTPFTKWEDEHTGYDYAYELKEAIYAIEKEVILYLGGKRAPKIQQSLDL